MTFTTLSRCFAVGLTAATLLVAVGCGGGGAPVNIDQGNNAFAGVYVSEFSRAQGRITLYVAQNGAVEVAVSDDAMGTLSGTGLVSKEGVFSASASGSGKSVQMSGNFSGAGDARKFAATLAGDAQANISGAYASSGSQNLFAGDYAGSYSGSAENNGTWTATIGTDGSVSGNAYDQYGSYTVTGTIDKLGVGTFPASGKAGGAGVTATWRGSFFKSGGQSKCAGTWSSNAGTSGNWSGASK